MISINFYEIVMQILNFSILLFLLNKFMFKPLGKYLNEREKTIKNNIDQAQVSNDEAQKLLDEQKELLNKAKVEAKEIRDQGEKTSKLEREKIISESKKDAEKILANASKEIEQGYSKAKNELLNEIGSLSIQLSKEVLKRDMKNSDHEEVVSSYLEKIKQ